MKNPVVKNLLIVVGIALIALAICWINNFLKLFPFAFLMGLLTWRGIWKLRND